MGKPLSDREKEIIRSGAMRAYSIRQIILALRAYGFKRSHGTIASCAAYLEERRALRADRFARPAELGTYFQHVDCEGVPLAFPVKLPLLSIQREAA